MPDRVIRQKVVCYIVRAGRLVVFRHLGQPWDTSGLQVPAGSIRPDELPESAAVREAGEETGLTVRLVRKLGEVRYDMAPYRPEIQHRHVFELCPQDDDPPERWVSRETDPEVGVEQPAFECYWIPLAQGHVLSAGQGALLGLLESG